ncbi:MAG: LysR family transcriptional regulator [Candidatus Thermoplasmatota archaeon]|nr:LysR family transcriptional regulator [Candidatus Thermoplasmatota archaeon]
MAVSVSITVGDGGRGVVGKGRITLLKLIEERGSLRKAAMDMGMSYRNAWGVIRHIEEQLDIRMVESSRGGANGGRTRLTYEARKMIDEYDSARERVDKALAGVLVHAEVLLVIKGEENGYLSIEGRLPRGSITENRPVPAVISELIGSLGIRPDRIRGPKVISGPGEEGLKLVFQMVTEGIPSGEWTALTNLDDNDREAVRLFIEPSIG